MWRRVSWRKFRIYKKNEGEYSRRKSDSGAIHEGACAQVPCLDARPAILQATASEPLTLDQEYEMQLSWVQDPLSMHYNFPIVRRYRGPLELLSSTRDLRQSHTVICKDGKIGECSDLYLNIISY